MKYTSTVEIDLPRARVIALFDDQDNYPSWQESLVSMKRVEGETGQVGTKTNLLHEMGRRKITMVETVTERALPDRFVATYEAKGVWNEAVNRFTELSSKAPPRLLIFSPRGDAKRANGTWFHGFFRVMAVSHFVPFAAGAFYDTSSRRY